MGTQSVAQFREAGPEEVVDRAEVLPVTEQAEHGPEASGTAVILIRWLSICFCLACWYGLYKVVMAIFF